MNWINWEEKQTVEETRPVGDNIETRMQRES